MKHHQEKITSHYKQSDLGNTNDGAVNAAQINPHYLRGQRKQTHMSNKFLPLTITIE